MKDRLDDRIDKALQEIVNCEAEVLDYLDKKLREKLSKQDDHLMRRKKRMSLMPAILIVLFNAALLIALTLNNIQLSGGLIEKLIIVYIGFSSVSSLGVIVLLVDSYIKEANYKFGFTKS